MSFAPTFPKKLNLGEIQKVKDENRRVHSEPELSKFILGNRKRQTAVLHKTLRPGRGEKHELPERSTRAATQWFVKGFCPWCDVLRWTQSVGRGHDSLSEQFGQELLTDSETLIKDKNRINWAEVREKKAGVEQLPGRGRKTYQDW